MISFQCEKSKLKLLSTTMPLKTTFKYSIKQSISYLVLAFKLVDYKLVNKEKFKDSSNKSSSTFFRILQMRLQDPKKVIFLGF